MSDVDPTLISGERTVFSSSQHLAALTKASWLPFVLAVVSIALGLIQPDQTTGVLGLFQSYDRVDSALAFPR